MDKVPILALVFLLLLFSANRAQAYSSYSLRKESILQPNLAVVLESGTVGISEIGVNGTTANVTVSCRPNPIVNSNFTDGSSTDAHNWTETPSTNIAVEWDSADENVRFYIEAAKVIEEATCYQDFDYSEASSANLTFRYAIDWQNPPPDAATLKVQLRLPNTTVFDLWTHNPTGTEAWTLVFLDIADYVDQNGTYRITLYVYVDTPSTAKLYSFRWDDVGIRNGTNGIEYDYVLNTISEESYHQNITLNLYNYENIGRLANCTVWFADSTTSNQIKIIDGSVITSSGGWCNLTALGEMHIASYAEESASGTSVLYIRLEAVKGNSIIYTCLIKLSVFSIS